VFQTGYRRNLWCVLCWPDESRVEGDETREVTNDLVDFASDLILRFMNKNSGGVEGQDEVAERRIGLDRSQEFREGGKRWEVNLTVEISADVGEETFRERVDQRIAGIVG